MKKLIAIICSLALIAGMSVTVFAEGSFDFGTSYTDEELTSDPTTETPVYGYIGPDAIIIDPDESDPDVEPEVGAHVINISVPVKIIWAAFQGDNGVVSSPDYEIRNNSAFKVDVTMTSFEVDEDRGIDHTTGTGELRLDINNTASPAQTIISDVVNATDAPLTVLDAKAGTTPGVFEFAISGNYSGDYPPTGLFPSYNMTLTFEVYEEPTPPSP